MLPTVVTGSRPRAVHRRALNGVGLAAAHLKAALRDRAFHHQGRRLHCEWLQEEDAVQRLGSCRSAAKLEVPRAREDDAALHDVVGNERMQRACKRGVAR